jgi:hypothetical protein
VKGVDIDIIAVVRRGPSSGNALKPASHMCGLTESCPAALPDSSHETSPSRAGES